jgi:hypothetical protein
VIGFRRRHADDDADRLAADHDLTPEQARRMRLHNRLSDVGLDPNRLVAVRWAVRRGLVNEWPTSRLEEIEGF